MGYKRIKKQHTNFTIQGAGMVGRGKRQGATVDWMAAVSTCDAFNGEGRVGEILEPWTGLRVWHDTSREGKRLRYVSAMWRSAYGARVHGRAQSCM